MGLSGAAARWPPVPCARAATSGGDSVASQTRHRIGGESQPVAGAAETGRRLGRPSPDRRFDDRPADWRRGGEEAGPARHAGPGPRRIPGSVSDHGPDPGLRGRGAPLPHRRQGAGVGAPVHRPGGRARRLHRRARGGRLHRHLPSRPRSLHRQGLAAGCAAGRTDAPPRGAERRPQRRTAPLRPRHPQHRFHRHRRRQRAGLHALADALRLARARPRTQGGGPRRRRPTPRA